MPVGFSGAGELGRRLGVSLAKDTVIPELIAVDAAVVN